MLTIVSRSARDGGLLSFDLWTAHTKSSMTGPSGEVWTSDFEGPRIKVERGLRDGQVELRVSI